MTTFFIAFYESYFSPYKGIAIKQGNFQIDIEKVYTVKDIGTSTVIYSTFSKNSCLCLGTKINRVGKRIAWLCLGKRIIKTQPKNEKSTNYKRISTEKIKKCRQVHSQI